MKKENELQKRAKYAKKHQKGMSPFSSFKTDVGDMELNAGAFNNAMGMSGGMGEDYDYTEKTVKPTYAIISSHCNDCPNYENKWNYAKLLSYASKYGDNYIEISGAESVLIFGIDLGWAMYLGERFDQNSIIFCDESGCEEICTCPFDRLREGDVIQEFSIDKIDEISAKKLLSHKKG